MSSFLQILQTLLDPTSKRHRRVVYPVVFNTSNAWYRQVHAQRKDSVRQHKAAGVVEKESRFSAKGASANMTCLTLGSIALALPTIYNCMESWLFNTRLCRGSSFGGVKDAAARLSCSVGPDSKRRAVGIGG